MMGLRLARGSDMNGTRGFPCRETTLMKVQIPVRQLWNFKAFSRRKDLSQMLHLYLYSWSGYLKHKQTDRELLSSSIIQTPLKL